MAVFVSLWVYVESGMKYDNPVLYVLKKAIFESLFLFFCMCFAYILHVNNILE